MIDFLKEISVIVLFTVAILGVVVGVVVGVAMFAEKNYCNTMESIHEGFEFQWDFWTGCLAQTPSGYWINAHEYHYLEGDVR